MGGVGGGGGEMELMFSPFVRERNVGLLKRMVMECRLGCSGVDAQF